MLPVDRGNDDLDTEALEFGMLVGTDAVVGDEGVDQVQPAECGSAARADLPRLAESSILLR